MLADRTPPAADLKPDFDSAVTNGIRRALFLLLLAGTGLVLAAGAAASGSRAGLRLSGRVTPEMGTWTRQASANVPLPSARLTIRNGSPLFAEGTIFLPFAWGTFAVRGLFLHELGHVYDSQSMTATRRLRFLQIAEVSCRWTAPHCRTVRWVSGPDVHVDVKPQEMFAEMYAACALGLTEREYEDAGYNTYGWVPPDGTDSDLCALIRSG